MPKTLPLLFTCFFLALFTPCSFAQSTGEQQAASLNERAGDVFGTQGVFIENVG